MKGTMCENFSHTGMERGLKGNMFPTETKKNKIPVEQLKQIALITDIMKPNEDFLKQKEATLK